jgi:hypothetical protein
MKVEDEPVKLSIKSMTRIAPLVGLTSRVPMASYSISDASLALRISLYLDSATTH